jgi:hypothetical protein
MAYKFADNVLGAQDIDVVQIQAPGTVVDGVGSFEPKLGEIRKAWDDTLGAAEFIYLKIPVSTAIPLGTVVQWTSGYTIAALPVLATSKNTGVSVAVAPVAIASDASNVRYGWFQIQGAAVVLKTAVQVGVTGVPVYASATAGRIKLLTSAGGQITGMRTFNAATVTTTTSTVTVFMDRPRMQGQIT